MLFIIYLLLFLVGIPIYIGAIYLFVLTVEAFFNKEKRNITGVFEGDKDAKHKFLIIIPAHNEALLLGDVLEDLKKLSYPCENWQVLVIADNCEDETAKIAAASGFNVVERFNDVDRGKGQALNWAIANELPKYDYDAVVVMDADSTMNPDFLWFMNEKLGKGHLALQAYYKVQNPRDSWRTSLMEIAFAAFHFLRSLGRMRLNASCGLKGNGMCLTRTIVEKYGYPAFSVVEDLELALFYLTNDIKVEFVSGAQVAGQMVSNSSDSDTQRRRWEGGRFDLIKQWCPKLFGKFKKERKFAFVDGIMELLVPPFSILVVVGFVGLIVSLVLPFDENRIFSSLVKSSWLLSCLIFVFYMLSGMILIKAGMFLYGRLFFAPIYVMWKMFTYGKMVLLKVFKCDSGEWVRTGRHKNDAGDNMDETETFETLMVMGLPFHNVTFKSTVDWSVKRMKAEQPTHICTANMDFVTRAREDKQFQRLLFESDLVVADGIPIVKISKFEGPVLKERVTGSDISPMLAEACRDNDLSVFGLGAAPGVADKAMKILQERYEGLKVAGAFSPPKAELEDMPHEEINKMLIDADTNLVLVAFGAPKQDKWGRMTVPKLKKTLAIGIGGTLDFIAGVQTRAPKFVQKVNLEWLWRLGTNPKRLFKRYAENICFFGYILFKQTMMKRAPWINDDVSCEELNSNTADNLNAFVIKYSDICSKDFAQSELLEKFSNIAATKNIVIDLCRERWLNSVELGTIASLCATTHKSQMGFAMVNLSERVKKYFEFYCLTDYFNVFRVGDVESYLADFNKLQKDVEIYRDGTDVKIVLPFELTVHNSDKLEEFIDNELPEIVESPISIIVDDSNCRFMDSSGSYILKRLEM
jgi:exopolysaccharide biosynthesis WecB/TagA/CpsF family protein